MVEGTALVKMMLYSLCWYDLGINSVMQCLEPQPNKESAAYLLINLATAMF